GWMLQENRDAGCFAHTDARALAAYVAESAVAAIERCFAKWLAISSAAFGPTTGLSSSGEALGMRSIGPNWRNSFILRFSPMPGISESSEVKSRISRRLR